MKLLSAILVGLLFVWAVGLYCENQSLKTETDYIPTIPELQQALIDTNQSRYDVGTDGADGIVGPNTIQGWENWTYDSYAAQWDYMYGAKK